VQSADAFVRVTAARGVDLAAGRLVPNPEKKPKMGRVVRDVAPVHAGAKDWCPSAHSPKTGLMYIPHVTMAMDREGVEANYVAGTPYVGVNTRMYPDPVDPGNGNMGAFTAWDPVQRKRVWRIGEKFPCWSGACATPGGVVFYGTMDGFFKAVDARTGDVG
jgi:glucose dehydrogenase